MISQIRVPPTTVALTLAFFANLSIDPGGASADRSVRTVINGCQVKIHPGGKFRLEFFCLQFPNKTQLQVIEEKIDSVRCAGWLLPRRQMLKIGRTANGEVVSSVSVEWGIAELERLSRSEANDCEMVLDFKDVTLANQDTINFLERCELGGITLKIALHTSVSGS